MCWHLRHCDRAGSHRGLGAPRPIVMQIWAARFATRSVACACRQVFTTDKVSCEGALVGIWIAVYINLDIYGEYPACEVPHQWVVSSPLDDRRSLKNASVFGSCMQLQHANKEAAATYREDNRLQHLLEYCILLGSCRDLWSRPPCFTIDVTNNLQVGQLSICKWTGSGDYNRFGWLITRLQFPSRSVFYNWHV